MRTGRSARTTVVRIRAGDAVVDGEQTVPSRATGLVVFAHAGGSSRFNPRNRSVAQRLVEGGLAVLTLDLLTRDEEALDVHTGEYRFDVDRLGRRIVAAIDWTGKQPELARLPLACFSASAGAAAALIAAAERADRVKAVVSRGGRPDLAGDALGRVRAPTLLIVGSKDAAGLDLNRAATRSMRAPVQIDIIPGATHLFEESGTLEQVSQLALKWCWRHLGGLA